MGYLTADDRLNDLVDLVRRPTSSVRWRLTRLEYVPLNLQTYSAMPLMPLASRSLAGRYLLRTY